jgi:hypothetical protein
MPEFVEGTIPCAGNPHIAKFVSKLSEQMIEDAEASQKKATRSTLPSQK